SGSTQQTLEVPRSACVVVAWLERSAGEGTRHRWRTDRRASGRYTPEQRARGGIDLQKMNWKFKAGFHEHTSVSLKAHMPNHPQGGYTRVHQDTAQSCDCQRPLRSSATRLSAR